MSGKRREPLTIVKAAWVSIPVEACTRQYSAEFNHSIFGYDDEVEEAGSIDSKMKLKLQLSVLFGPDSKQSTRHESYPTQDQWALTMTQAPKHLKQFSVQVEYVLPEGTGERKRLRNKITKRKLNLKLHHPMVFHSFKAPFIEEKDQYPIRGAAIFCKIRYDPRQLLPPVNKNNNKAKEPNNRHYVDVHRVHLNGVQRSELLPLEMVKQCFAQRKALGIIGGGGGGGGDVGLVKVQQTEDKSQHRIPLTTLSLKWTDIPDDVTFHAAVRIESKDFGGPEGHPIKFYLDLHVGEGEKHHEEERACQLALVLCEAPDHLMQADTAVGFPVQVRFQREDAPFIDMKLKLNSPVVLAGFDEMDYWDDEVLNVWIRYDPRPFIFNIPTSIAPPVSAENNPILAQMNELRQSTKHTLTDFTFEVAGTGGGGGGKDGNKTKRTCHRFQANKIVLSLLSPGFREIFCSDENPNGKNDTLLIEDIDHPEAVEAMLTYLYVGQLPKDFELLASDLLILAQKFSIESLVYHCQRFLYRPLMYSISPDSACRTLQLFDQANCEQAKQWTLKFIQLNLDQVKATSGWAELEHNPQAKHLLDLIINATDDDLMEHSIEISGCVTNKMLEQNCMFFGTIFDEDSDSDSDGGGYLF